MTKEMQTSYLSTDRIITKKPQESSELRRESLPWNPKAIEGDGGETNPIYDPTFIIILLGFVIVGTIKQQFIKYLSQIYRSLFSANFASLLYRSEQLNSTPGSYRLDLLFFMMAPLYLTATLEHYNITPLSSNFIHCYAIIFAVVALFTLLKTITLKIIGSITVREDIFNEYIFNFRLYNKVLGLTLLLINPLLIFSNIDSNVIYISSYIIISIVVIAACYRTLYVLYTKGVSNVYLFLYLCTLEIIPTLITARLVYGWIE